ncbi:acyl-CoA dehydrogenase family protein [Actinoplanes sp. N902-109]|uniref:acyl-CoA dehydrogenase family protein n=1 Tax=Actinoplanes sp. (strain N902-109) TaxID=649831 RepID=UPI0003295087|nr:acyl-CoA dehydrogenase family protein [Actinoplanes sp. N902-109]AGL19219.1 Glutaryl-CoA dehydrogenase [Actinoplanes sp. N902-109]
MDNDDFLALDDQLDDAERSVRDTVRAYADEHFLPRVDDWYQDGELPRQIAKDLGGLGLLGMQLDGYGCANASPAAYGVACRELEAVDSGLRSFLSVQSCLAMYAIHRWGDDRQRQEWLPAMAAGDALGCFGLTEPESGSDPASMRTVARRVGGDWVIDGTKAWISNATIADVAVIWAGTEAGPRGFLVPSSAPGWTATEIRDKLSLRASVSTNLRLENVRVPASAMLPLGRGLKAPLSCLNEARFGILWGLAGAARTCYSAALEYAGRRHQFGRPIAGFQLTQRKLATMVVELTHAGLTAFRLAQLKRAGTVTPEQISLGKLANARSAIEVARTARTILGADGITMAHPVARHLANLDAVLTVEGTEEMHQLIIGRAVTGISAFR